MIPVGILTAAATSSFSFLLDQYPGAIAAYSLRKLRSAYTGFCIQVRRSTDNATQNIGFVNNVLDTTTLLTFVGAGNGFVSIFYNQSTNSSNITQSTLANQPIIVNSGSLITLGTKPAMFFDGVNDSLNNVAFFLTGSNLSTYQVFKINDTVFATNFGGFSDYLYYGNISGGGAPFSIPVINLYKNNVLTSTTTTTAVYTAYGQNTYILSSGYFGTVNFAGFGFSNLGTLECNAYLQEIIVYVSNQSSNNTAINANINSFYTIY